MASIRKTLFISDLHLEEASPQISTHFLQFLTNCDSNTDAIYILGDLFETWIGDDNRTAFNLKIIQAIREVSNRGVPIFFLCGNRDFLIGKKFLKEAGCQRLMDEHKVLVYDTPVLLMHGDTLCTEDVAYLRARRFLRNYLSVTIFSWLPLLARQKFADGLRSKSRRHTRSANQHIMDVTQSAVEDVMQKHAVHYLVHGHTHKPAIHEIRIKNIKAERIVLGAWHNHGSALVWYSNGSKELVSF